MGVGYTNLRVAWYEGEAAARHEYETGEYLSNPYVNGCLQRRRAWDSGFERWTEAKKRHTGYNPFLE